MNFFQKTQLIMRISKTGTPVIDAKKGSNINPSIILLLVKQEKKKKNTNETHKAFVRYKPFETSQDLSKKHLKSCLSKS